ncbi:hypothetical protein PR048_007817 [Dryococelus australis]|uniref:Uncharacterized protein n=1 Tax=Dryococelus australis TaxID=614101 RepID=A0ABQ9HVC1_9NEOP|nr:hypothetical protein PR048_007817 [Dryococelus australis]
MVSHCSRQNKEMLSTKQVLCAIFRGGHQSERKRPFGWANKTFGWTNKAFGWTNKAFGWANTAFGWTNEAFGWTNTAFGWTNTAFGWTNKAFGWANKEFGWDKAFGWANKAFVRANKAFGRTNNAFSWANKAFGWANKAFSWTDKAFDEEEMLRMPNMADGMSGCSKKRTKVQLSERKVFRGLSWQQATLASPPYTRDIIVYLLVAVINTSIRAKLRDRDKGGRRAVLLGLDCSPPTKASRVRFPAGSLPNFRMWELCQSTSRPSPAKLSSIKPGDFKKPYTIQCNTILSDYTAGRRVFSGSPVPPALAFRRCSILTSFHPHRFSRPRCKYPPKCLHSLTVGVHNTLLDRWHLREMFKVSTIYSLQGLPVQALTLGGRRPRQPAFRVVTIAGEGRGDDYTNKVGSQYRLNMRVCTLRAMVARGHLVSRPTGGPARDAVAKRTSNPCGPGSTPDDAAIERASTLPSAILRAARLPPRRSGFTPGILPFPRPCIPAPLHTRVSFHILSGDDGHLGVPAGTPVSREEIRAALYVEILRADEGELRSVWSRAGMQGRGETGETWENPADHRHRPARFPHAKIPGIEPGSSQCEASSLTFTSPRHPKSTSTTKLTCYAQCGSWDNPRMTGFHTICGIIKHS